MPHIQATRDNIIEQTTYRGALYRVPAGNSFARRPTTPKIVMICVFVYEIASELPPIHHF